MSQRPLAIAARPSADREDVVIVFGNEEVHAWYGRFAPSDAIRVAQSIIKIAEGITQVREEITH